MYFEIENTPEHIKRTRKVEKAKEQSPNDEVPRLIVAPFSRPPQVVFENVLIGTVCQRSLEVFNPSKQVQQITLSNELPPGLIIHLPGECITLEPETCYCLTMEWAPMQPTAVRETLHFTNDSRGRYDVFVVLKSVMQIQSKNKQTKGYKVSPGKLKRKSIKKTSPVAIYKKNNTSSKVKKTVTVQSTAHTKYKSFNKENMSATMNEKSMDYSEKCPFTSPNSIEFTFNTSELFSNMKKPNNLDVLQQTYENNYRPSVKTQPHVPQNVLKPSNKQNFENASDIFDNFTFTPLKSVPSKSEKLNKDPQIIISMNSESDFDDSLDNKHAGKENATHSILCISSKQTHNNWLNLDTQRALENDFTDARDDCGEPPVAIQNKKIPNTSSPKEFNSPNFTINTEFSRISELSFLPQRFSTERKLPPKTDNDTHDLLDSVGFDTFTKESPNYNPYPSLEPHLRQAYSEVRPQAYQPKLCRQSLFKECQSQRDLSDKNYYRLQNCESELWQNNLRADIRSPPRSITPPLQSIPEESTHFSDTQVLDRTDKQSTFTINRTFEKPERSSISHSTRESWSKKATRVESELWKVPVSTVKRATKAKTKKDVSAVKDTTFEANKTATQNISLNVIGNVYSQSLTVDPFLSSTYFYDEEAVNQFEKEFKRWLNYILTPPADLESNVEQKIDVGKAWLENRNKEVPAAPTKEQVCSQYHTSHRLQSLRRAARELVKIPEMAKVFLKLNAQIEKKLIAIRADRNLHLDVGLQKIIMELLLSYNPLWLRLGLEAIYGIMIPLKCNSDIEGLTKFIIQRMFKNPFLKNKHTKSNAPNMLLPAYMDAIKKFTVKKFFMLVFFLDQAKQKKLIPHDPCLFCRNAVCKESRDVIIRFTKELIAGIGDITKHLRPLGYVVSHKQSYLDEYKYAVHNIAVDIRDGVRLTKVMEIILIKNGLLNQLRTPAISRLQKIHNVQVALNALKEANFTIDGDISANDIADGHREKTLSLLWQLIHVFRAPLFVSAANVIQTWWRKKYQVIVAKRMEEERVRQRHMNAASAIQCWWRRIQYNRLVEWKMQQITSATVVVQKYCRMWLCKTRLRKLKASVLKIEDWYRTVKLMREAKKMLVKLRSDREELICRSAIKIQSCVKRWLAVRQYSATIKRVVLIQSIVRCYLVRKWYVKLQKMVRYVQERYRSKLMMKEEMRRLSEKRKSAVIIQSHYRMLLQRRLFTKLKQSVRTLEERYVALIEMRKQRFIFLKLKLSAIVLQSLYRGKIERLDYEKQRNSIINLQRRVRANQLMRKERCDYLSKKKAAIILQSQFRAYLAMKEQKSEYTVKRKSVLVIQKHYRSYKLMKQQRYDFLRLRQAAVSLQKHYKSLVAMRKMRAEYLRLKEATVIIQRRYRAQKTMQKIKRQFQKLQTACITVQQRFRANLRMRHQRTEYQKLKYATVLIQNALRAHTMGKKQRQEFLTTKDAAITIQRWFRRCFKTKQVQEKYQHTKQACITLQRVYRAYILGKHQRREYLRIKAATVCLQKYYRLYVEMRTIREQYIQLKTSTIKIQRFYRAFQLSKKQREEYLLLRNAAVKIQTFYRSYKETQMIRYQFIELRKASVCFQRRYRSICEMRRQRSEYLRMKKAAVKIQRRFRALACMRKYKKSFEELRLAAIVIQKRFRAKIAMRQERAKYERIRKACIQIQRAYRCLVVSRRHRQQYLQFKDAAMKIQQRYRAILAMRVQREAYEKLRYAAIVTQRQYRAQKLMVEERNKYGKIILACSVIQTRYRALVTGKTQKEEYIKLKIATVTIQRRYRLLRETRKIRGEYLRLKTSVTNMQRRFRANKISHEVRQEFLTVRKSVVIIQSTFKMYVYRKQYLTIRNAAICIQKHYRARRLGQTERQNYVHERKCIIKVQAQIRSCLERKRYLKLRAAATTIQSAYRLKMLLVATKKLRTESATCIQKYVRRYLVRKRYENYRRQVIFVQKLWRSKMITRLLRCEYLHKIKMIIKLQATVRGYQLRKRLQTEKVQLEAAREEKRIYRAASKIQALFRGHRARLQSAHDRRLKEMRRRWREGALQSTQQSLRERSVEAMDVLSNTWDIETVIRAFRSLELLTEVLPMKYHDDAATIARLVYTWMSVTNRSISSIEVLKSASLVLVNLTRYKTTGPKMYARHHIAAALKFMWRFSNSEPQLFCILCTYLWLFDKYDCVREDLSEFLRLPDNHKMLVSIKGNVDRMRRMAGNAVKNRFSTAQPNKFISHTHNHSLNHSMREPMTPPTSLPALEPDYGIRRADRPRYFEDASQAISCLFRTFQL